MCELSDLTAEGQLRSAIRYGVMAVFGGAVAIFGCGANAILAYLFIGKFNYRHSPFFFMGFVAFFDTLIDVMYLLVNTLPISSQQFLWKSIYLLWLQHAQWLLVLVQIFKLASTFCLVIASYERYHLTKHWTTSGFDYRTRWILLVLIVGLAVFIKVFHPTKCESPRSNNLCKRVQRNISIVSWRLYPCGQTILRAARKATKIV